MSNNIYLIDFIMKNRKLTFISFLLAIVSLSFSSCGEIETNNIDHKTNLSTSMVASEYTIAFYNVENLFDTEDDPFTSDDEFTPNGEKRWTEKRYHKKLKNIAKVASALDSSLPMLFGVCEVENLRVLEDLVQEPKLQKANYGIVHFDSPDTRGIDVALMYKKDYFEVLETESLEVSFERHPNVLTRDILYVKGVLNGEEINVFVNHWSSRRKGEKATEYKRLEAAEVLKDRIEEIQELDAKAKIIVMGDFNDYPNNSSIVDVLEASLEPKSDEFYNLAAKLDKNYKGSHFYNDEWGMLDQMMISNSWLSSKKGNVIKDKTVSVFKPDWVLFNHFKLGMIPSKTYSGQKYHGGYSDHLAVYLKMKFKK